MIKKIFPVLIVLSLVIAMFASCSGDGQDFPVMVAHDEIKSEPESVGVLNDSVADVIIACGLQDKIKVKTENCSQAELSTVESVGELSNPNFDKLVEINPDIIFADETISIELYNALTERGITVLRMPRGNSIQEIQTLYKSVCRSLKGDAAGTAIATETIEKLSKQIEQAGLEGVNAEEHPTVCLTYSTGNVAVKDSYGDMLLSYAGLANAVSETATSATIDIISTLNPGYIICAAGKKADVLNNSALANVDAVKNERIIEIDEALFTRQGNSMVKAVETLVEQFYGKTSGELPTESGDSLLYSQYDVVVDSDTVISLGEGTDAIDTLEGEERQRALNVLGVQRRLDELGYMSDDPTGYFGSITEQAVIEFKENNGLSTENSSLDKGVLDKLFSTDAVPRSTPAREGTTSGEEDTTEAPTV